MKLSRLPKSSIWYILDMLMEEDPATVSAYLARQVRDFEDRKSLKEWVASLQEVADDS